MKATILKSPLHAALFIFFSSLMMGQSAIASEAPNFSKLHCYYFSLNLYRSEHLYLTQTARGKYNLKFSRRDNYAPESKVFLELNMKDLVCETNEGAENIPHADPRLALTCENNVGQSFETNFFVHPTYKNQSGLHVKMTPYLKDDKMHPGRFAGGFGSNYRIYYAFPAINESSSRQSWCEVTP